MLVAQYIPKTEGHRIIENTEMGRIASKHTVTVACMGRGFVGKKKISGKLKMKSYEKGKLFYDTVSHCYHLPH